MSTQKTHTSPRYLSVKEIAKWYIRDISARYEPPPGKPEWLYLAELALFRIFIALVLYGAAAYYLPLILSK